MSPILRFWKLLSQYNKELRLLYAYAIFSGLVNLSLPVGIQAIVNFIQMGEITTSWIITVAFVLMGIAIGGILQVLQLRIVENIQQNIFARSSFEFAYRIPKIKLSSIENYHAPELVNRFFDTLTIQKGLPKVLIDFLLAVFQIVFGLILLAFYNSMFIILGVGLFLLLWIIFKVTGPKGLSTSLTESKYKYRLVYWLEEVARTNKSFKIDNADIFHLKKADKITCGYIGARESHFKVLLGQFKYFIVFKVLLAAGLLVLGGFLVFRGQMNIGQFVAAEIMIILIINSIEKVIGLIDDIYDVLTALEKIGYVSDLPLDENKGKFTSDTLTAASVEVNDISFSYPKQNKNIFENFSCKISPGEVVMLTGESGSGKSTFLHLISGLYQLNAGYIRIDGMPIEQYDKDTLFKNVGIFFPFDNIFEGTIEENITLGKEVSSKDLDELLELLSLKEFLTTQSDGIYEQLSSGGRRLPKAVSQKLLLARVLLTNPRLLLLEDPLRFVKQEEKQKIMDYIKDPSRNWTVIVVTEDSCWAANTTAKIEL